MLRLILACAVVSATFIDRKSLKSLSPDDQVMAVGEYLEQFHSLITFNCRASPFYRTLRQRYPRGLKHGLLKYLGRHEGKVQGATQSGIDWSGLAGEEQERFLQCAVGNNDSDAIPTDNQQNADNFDDNTRRRPRSSKNAWKEERKSSLRRAINCARKSELHLAELNVQLLSKSDGDFDRELRHFEWVLQRLRDIQDYDDAGIPWPWLSEEGWTWHWVLPLVLIIVLILVAIGIAIWWFLFRKRKGYEWGKKTKSTEQNSQEV